MHTPPLLLRKKEAATVLLYLIVDALALIFGVAVVVLNVLTSAYIYPFITLHPIIAVAIQAIGVGKFPCIIYLAVHYLNY